MQRESHYVRLEASIHALNKGMKEWLASHLESDLTQAQYYILVLLSETGMTTVSQLAQHLGVTSSAVTTMTDRLLRAGLVFRIRSNDDRRVVTIQLSDEGQQLVSRMQKGREKVLHNLFQSLNDEELKRFSELYEKVVRSFQKEWED